MLCWQAGLLALQEVWLSWEQILSLISWQTSTKMKNGQFIRSLATFALAFYRLFILPSVMPAWDALHMAKIEGAKAIGLGDEIGSLEVGKQADLIMVDLKALNLSPVLDTPVRNIVPNLVCVPCEASCG
jgi:formylmethanofuran dehydrogenase subunit A